MPIVSKFLSTLELLLNILLQAPTHIQQGLTVQALQLLLSRLLTGEAVLLLVCFCLIVEILLIALLWRLLQVEAARIL